MLLEEYSMLLQVLDSNVTELALQLVLVLLGEQKKKLVDAILVKYCGRGCSWEGGRQHVTSRYDFSRSCPHFSVSAPSL